MKFDTYLSKKWNFRRIALVLNIWSLAPFLLAEYFVYVYFVSQIWEFVANALLFALMLMMMSTIYTASFALIFSIFALLQDYRKKTWDKWSWLILILTPFVILTPFRLMIEMMWDLLF